MFRLFINVSYCQLRGQPFHSAHQLPLVCRLSSFLSFFFLLSLILFFLTENCLSKKKCMYHTVLIVLRVDLGGSRELMPMFCSPSLTRKSYSCSLSLLFLFFCLPGWKEMIIIPFPYLYFQKGTFTPTATP